MYPHLHNLDSIRILELTRIDQKDTLFCSRLVAVRLEKSRDYVALSYAWGKKSSDDPVLHVNGHALQIRASLWQALEELTTHSNTIRLWVDQICIDQDNKTEQEQQVRLMSRIYAQAKRVIGWLGGHDKDNHLAFDLLLVLGGIPNARDVQHDFEWRRAADALMKDGHLCKEENLFNPASKPLQAVVCLVKRSWFYRLWIVQEVALASALELRCGSSSISGDIFFNAIRILCSAVSDPPMPWLLQPYRNAYKLGQLRAQVAAGQNHSFPHLAHTLSGWLCGKDHDRLIALFGLVFRNTQAWFKPSYSIPAPDLYTEFAQAHILLEGSLDILHFAGCGDNDAHDFARDGDQVMLQLEPPPDDVPSWVPDWRMRSRPLTLATNVEHGCPGFSATASDPEFEFQQHMLRVRAREVDIIKVCGWPYYESLGRLVKMTEHDVFSHWYSMAKAVLIDANVDTMFASTLVMDGKVAVTERQAMEDEAPDIPSLFKHWACRNLKGFGRPREGDWEDGIDDSTRYGYVAEEVCRDRTFFVTEAGRLGLGPVHISPGDCIHLIHGLKTPFVLHRGLGTYALRGECYVHGLMDGNVQRSGADNFLHIR